MHVDIWIREFEAARDCAVVLPYLCTGIANQVAHKCIMNLPTKLYYAMEKKNANVNISTTGNGFGNKKKSICFVTFYAINSRKINGFCFFFVFGEEHNVMYTCVITRGVNKREQKTIAVYAVYNTVNLQTCNLAAIYRQSI